MSSLAKANANQGLKKGRIFSLSHLNVLVDLLVEENQHGEGQDVDDQQAQTVIVIEGVLRVAPQRRHRQLRAQLAVTVPIRPLQLSLQELGRVEGHGGHGHRDDILQHASHGGAFIISSLKIFLIFYMNIIDIFYKKLISFNK
jgi:hypothetical protein